MRASTEVEAESSIVIGQQKVSGVSTPLRRSAQTPTHFFSYARPMYVPVRVSTRMTSPSLINRGTWMVLPVSSFAGFCTLFAL